MRVRNHALDGLRGLAALGVLTLHVWMFTVQGAHGRDELVSLLTGEPAAMSRIEVHPGDAERALEILADVEELDEASEP